MKRAGGRSCQNPPVPGESAAIEVTFGRAGPREATKRIADARVAGDDSGVQGAIEERGAVHRATPSGLCATFTAAAEP